MCKTMLTALLAMTVAAGAAAADTATLVVTVSPHQAHVQGAMWRFVLEQPEEWRAPRQPVSGLAEGEYEIEFMPIEECAAPPVQKMFVESGQIHYAEGQYVCQQRRPATEGHVR